MTSQCPTQSECRERGIDARAGVHARLRADARTTSTTHRQGYKRFADLSHFVVSHLVGQVHDMVVAPLVFELRCEPLDDGGCQRTLSHWSSVVQEPHLSDVPGFPDRH